MQTGRIIIRFQIQRLPFLRIKIIQRMIFFACETKEPVSCRIGRDVCLLHSADWKCTDDPLVAALHRFCIVLIKRASLLIDQDSVLM